MRGYLFMEKSRTKVSEWGIGGLLFFFKTGNRKHFSQNQESLKFSVPEHCTGYKSLDIFKV